MQKAEPRRDLCMQASKLIKALHAGRKVNITEANRQGARRKVQPQSELKDSVAYIFQDVGREMTKVVAGEAILLQRCEEVTLLCSL